MPVGNDPFVGFSKLVGTGVVGALPFFKIPTKGAAAPVLGVAPFSSCAT